MVTGPYRGAGEREPSRGLVDTQLMKVTQLDHQAILDRKADQRLMQPLRSFSLLTLYVGRTRRISQAGSKGFAHRDVGNGPLLQQSKNFVKDDGAQPGLKARFTAKLPQVTEG